jgi:hypothetical protein
MSDGASRAARFGVFAVFPSNYQPSDSSGSQKSWTCRAIAREKTAAAIADPR